MGGEDHDQENWEIRVSTPNLQLSDLDHNDDQSHLETGESQHPKLSPRSEAWFNVH